MEPPATDIPEHTALPDLTGTSMIALLHANDPALRRGLARLMEAAEPSTLTTSGWTSFLDYE